MTTNQDTAHDAAQLDRFETEVMPYLDRLYSAALCMTGDSTEANDLVAECFTRAVASFRALDENTDVRTWLFRLLVDTCRGRCRPDLINELDDLRRAETVALARLPDARVRAALHQLPTPYRVTVYLADVEGCTFGEIAEITRMSVGAVAARLHHGRRRLRMLLLHLSAMT